MVRSSPRELPRGTPLRRCAPFVVFCKDKTLAFFPNGFWVEKARDLFLVDTMDGPHLLQAEHTQALPFHRKGFALPQRTAARGPEVNCRLGDFGTPAIG